MFKMKGAKLNTKKNVHGIYIADFVWAMLKEESEKTKRSINFLISEIMESWAKKKKSAKWKSLVHDKRPRQGPKPAAKGDLRGNKGALKWK